MEILNTVFNMSITGSIIFFIFLLIKPLTKKHFDSSWHYKMLILILTLFIIPVNNFIKLPINPMPNIPNLEIQESRVPENINIREEIKHVENNKSIEKQESEYGIKDKVKDKDINLIETKNQNFQDIKFNINFYKDMIKYIWTIGVITLFLLKVIPYTRFKSSILRDSTIIEEEDILKLFNICKDELNLNTTVSLRICGIIGSPMLIGIFHPTVLIPDIDEGYKRLKMIFLHELNHYKRKDIIIKVFGLIINAIHWFNPIIYILLKEMDKYCEYSIDEKVVEKMDINDRKYYGETILNLIGNSMLKKVSLTTTMGNSGKQLKTRLENMIYSFKTTRKKQIISLFIGILILISGFTVACSILPNNTAEENDSFVVYIKEDGLYYSYLNGGEEAKIHEGNEFANPLISKTGDYIAYNKGKSLYIYDVKNEKYEKLTERQHFFDNFYEWLDDEIVYSSEKPGFIIYNPRTKEKREHVDEYHYENFKVSNKNLLYAKKFKRWSTEEGDFTSIQEIVEIDLDNYNGNDNRFEIFTIIEGKEPTNAMLGYDPTISKITEDGRYIFIMEKFASGSTSADYAGIGLYDTKERVHIDFTDIYGDESTDPYEEENLVVLPNINNLAINPKDNNLISIIKGGYREPFMNKEIVLLNIDKDKSYEIINFMDKDLAAMTPSFTLDGGKLLYSASKAIDPDDYNEAYKDWENQPHNIYEYDLKTSQIRKLTEGNEFDFMPINISKDEILFLRLSTKGYGNLVKIKAGKEEILAENLKIDSFREKNIDLFLGKKNKDNVKKKGISKKEKQSLTDEAYNNGKDLANRENILNLEDVYTDHYHFQENHNGNVYLIRRIEPAAGEEWTDDNWTDELWRYDKNNKGEKLYACQGLDFRVSPNEKYISIIDHNELCIIDTKGNKVKKYTIEELSNDEYKNEDELQVDMQGWSDDSLNFWGRVNDLWLPLKLSKINVVDWSITEYDMTQLSIGGTEFMLNPNIGKIVFSDFPITFDVDDLSEFEMSKEKVTLFYYDLVEKKLTIIDSSAAKMFNPEWIDDFTIEFDNPKGQDRITYKLKD